MSCTLTYLRSQDRKGVFVQIPRFSVPCKLTLIGLISSLNYRQRELVITSGSNRLSPKDTIRSFMSRMKEWGGVGIRKPVCILVPFHSFIQRRSFALYPRFLFLFSTWILASFRLGKALYKGGLSRGVHLGVSSFLTPSPGW